MPRTTVRGPWRGGSQARAPRPEAAASSSRPSRVAPSRTSADTSSRGIRSLLSRGVAVPPDVRPWQARRPNVPGDHFPVPGTTVSFPEFVIQPIAVILPTSQTYPILREFSGVSRKKKASDSPIPIFSPDFLGRGDKSRASLAKESGRLYCALSDQWRPPRVPRPPERLGPVDKLLVPPSRRNHPAGRRPGPAPVASPPSAASTSEARCPGAQARGAAGGRDIGPDDRAPAPDRPARAPSGHAVSPHRIRGFSGHVPPDPDRSCAT